MVDDDQINLLVAYSYPSSSQEFKFIISTASNGSIAIDMVLSNKNNTNEPFDIIVMDCDMPIMDGFEATRIIKEEKFLKAGMKEFISKPYSKMDLFTKIMKALQLSET